MTEQVKFFKEIQETLRIKHRGLNRWYIVCQKQLIGNFATEVEARNFGREEVKKMGTEVFFVGQIR